MAPGLIRISVSHHRLGLYPLSLLSLLKSRRERSFKSGNDVCIVPGSVRDIDLAYIALRYSCLREILVADTIENVRKNEDRLWSPYSTSRPQCARDMRCVPKVVWSVLNPSSITRVGLVATPSAGMV